MVRNTKNTDFNNHSLTNISQNNLNSEPTDDINAATKSYVDSLSENDKNSREMFLVFSDQDNEFDNNKLTNVDSIKINRNPTLHEEVSKKHVDNELDKSKIKSNDAKLFAGFCWKHYVYSYKK